MILRTASLAVLGLAILGAAYVRLAPMSPDDWHVDPEKIPAEGSAKAYLVAPGGDAEPPRFDATPEALLERFDAVAMADTSVERLAGSPAEGMVTYVQRSRLMGYPDAVTVKSVADGEGSRLMVYSRSRYGQSDLGVNRVRMERWLAALDT